MMLHVERGKTQETIQSGEKMPLPHEERHRQPIMNGLGLRLAAQAAVLAVVALAVAGAGGANAASLSQKTIKAKMDYCEVCHGVQARGFVGFFPVPRLAGQQVEYIENELKGFVDRKRQNKTSPEKTNVMFNVGHVLSPEMIKALAVRFHALNPKPVGGAPQDLVAAGKQIFTHGIPSAKVPACETCHGKDAKGNGPIPRLAGQLYPYIVSQLSSWGKERAETNSQLMAPIAHSLTKQQIKSVAAYVSGLD